MGIAKGNPVIAKFMRGNDQSVDPPRKSWFVNTNPDGSEIWADEESILRVWPNGMMDEIPKEK